MSANRESNYNVIGAGAAGLAVAEGTNELGERPYPKSARVAVPSGSSSRA